MVKRIYKIIKAIVLSAFLFIILFFVVYSAKKVITKDVTSSVFGYSFYQVTTGSMIPDINPGDLVVVKRQKEYKVGMDVTYQLNEKATPITHKIVKIEGNTITTMGINNNGSFDDSFDASCIVGEVVGIWRDYIKFINFITSPIGIIIIVVGMFGIIECVVLLDKIIYRNNEDDEQNVSLDEEKQEANN